MVVIAHENPRMNKPPRLFASFPRRLDKHPPILVASDDALTPVTSRHDMVQRALKMDPDLSCHPSKSYLTAKSVKNC
jgi:hypothetical protein